LRRSQCSPWATIDRTWGTILR